MGGGLLFFVATLPSGVGTARDAERPKMSCKSPFSGYTPTCLDVTLPTLGSVDPCGQAQAERLPGDD